MYYRLLFLLCSIACAILVQSQNYNPLVRTAHGVVVGSWSVSKGGRTYASFQGIPYARPPVGKHRFREPQRLKPWTGTWDASRPGPACLQYDPFIGDLQGSENCLFVNVYTPHLNAAATLPVLVYIHGGAFMYGAGGLYNPRHLMDRDMVVVTLNYRLGPLGFLSTGDEVVPGNMGLKDQSFALQWVQENILMFGGDSNQVTVSGCSAGGASVHYHYLSPMSRGLFTRAIAFSGSALLSWTQAVRPAERAREIAAHIGCPALTSREMIECLRYRPAETVVRAQNIYFEWREPMFTPFRPTVEPPTSRAFLSQPPHQAARAGPLPPASLLTSVTSEEGLYPAAAYLSDPEALAELEAHWSSLASYVLEYNDTLPASRRADVAVQIKSHYLQGKPISIDTFPQLVQAMGDRLFATGVGRAAELAAARSPQPVHLYRFSFRGEKSLSNLMARDDKDYGTSHGDDVFHLFDFPGLEMDSPEDNRMRDILIDMVFSFASTGIPKIKGVEWTPLVPGSSHINYLEISSPDRIFNSNSSDFGQRSFWNSLGFAENENAHLAMRDEL